MPWIGTASGYRFEQRIAGCRAELLKVADPEPLDRGVVEQHLADRPQADLRDIAERALGQRVEGADTLEVVAEQVEPERAFAAAREDVDDAAAHGILARLHHRAAAPVAVAGEAGEQLGAVDALAGGPRTGPSASASGGGTFCTRALIVVMTRRGPPVSSSRASVSSRCAMMSEFGETRS